MVASNGQAIATSSTQLRTWTAADGATRHHIVDPRTGRHRRPPCGAGDLRGRDRPGGQHRLDRSRRPRRRRARMARGARHTGSARPRRRLGDHHARLARPHPRRPRRAPDRTSDHERDPLVHLTCHRHRQHRAAHGGPGARAWSRAVGGGPGRQRDRRHGHAPVGCRSGCSASCSSTSRRPIARDLRLDRLDLGGRAVHARATRRSGWAWGRSPSTCSSPSRPPPSFATGSRSRRGRRCTWLSYAMWPIALVHGYAWARPTSRSCAGSPCSAAWPDSASPQWRALASQHDRDRREAVLAQEWS